MGKWWKKHSIGDKVAIFTLIATILGIAIPVVGFIVGGSKPSLSEVQSSSTTWPTTSTSATTRTSAPDTSLTSDSTAISVTTSAPPAAPRTPVTVELASLEPVRTENFTNGNAVYNTGSISIAGETYPQSVITEIGPCGEGNSNRSVEFLLSRKYSRLHASAGIGDDAVDPTLRVRIQVLGDNRVLYSHNAVLGKALPIVDLNVRSVLRLQIRVNFLSGDPAPGGCVNGVAGLGDPILTQVG
jgi:hypothetical protein